MSNLKCGCGREIRKEDDYFILINSEEQPVVFCEFCVSINR